MISWLQPAAFAGLVLLAVPIVIHLLMSHRAARVPFPSLRFVPRSPPTAVRMHLPSDLLLLLLRLAIVALAVVALARPLVVFPSRVAAWNARTVRAVVVDNSESVKPSMDEAAAVAAAEMQGTVSAIRVDSEDLRSGLERAVARLDSMPPARREVVVVSDFQRGALTPAALAIVPSSVGLRFVQIGTGASDRTMKGLTLYGPTGSSSQDVALSGPWTTVRTQSAAPERGLEILAAPSDDAAASSLARVVAASGAPAPSSREPMTLVFAGGAGPETIGPIARPWMIATVLRLSADPEVAEAARAVDAVDVPQQSPWHVLFRDRRSRPLVRASAAGEGLVIHVAAGPSAFVSAAVARALLIARQGPVAHPEQEVQRMAPAELAALERQSAPVGEDAGRRSEGNLDGRICWAVVLALVGLEALVRRRRRTAAVEVTANAA